MYLKSSFLPCEHNFISPETQIQNQPACKGISGGKQLLGYKVRSWAHLSYSVVGTYLQVYLC